MWEDYSFIGLQLDFFDQTTQTIGLTDGRHRMSSYTFKAGETLTGNLFLGLWWNEEIWAPALLAFTTTSGSWTVGNTDSQNIVIPADGRQITGMFGRSEGPSGILTQLGLLFTKKIKSSVLTNIQYPTLASLETGLTPSLIQNRFFCNDGLIPDSESLSYSSVTGSSSCWNIEGSMSFGVSVSVTAGVPEIATTTQGFQWSVSVTGGYESCKDSSTSITSNLNLNIPANSNCSVHITQWNSRIDSLPYTGDLVLTFLDGTTATMPTASSYSGAYISDASINKDCHELQGRACVSKVQAGVCEIMWGMARVAITNKCGFSTSAPTLDAIEIAICSHQWEPGNAATYFGAGICIGVIPIQRYQITFHQGNEEGQWSIIFAGEKHQRPSKYELRKRDTRGVEKKDTHKSVSMKDEL
jgi:hypothetical protein